MNKEQVKNEQVLPNLKPGENLVGFFLAVMTPSFTQYFFLGPLAAFSIRNYIVVVTDQGMHLHKLNMMNKPDGIDYFTYEEITKLKLKDGLLQAPLELEFSNGRKIKLKAQLKAVTSVPVLDEITKNYLISKSK